MIPSRIPPGRAIDRCHASIWCIVLCLVTAWLGAGRSAAATTVLLGEVKQIAGPADLDLDGEFAYAINFSANDPGRTLRGVTFLPDRLGIPGATLVGPQQVTAWQTKPEFGATGDANALEEILYDIRWANSGGGERLKATLAVKVGEEYKLQILISGNGPEDRHWDIRVNGKDAVDEITSLGASPGQTYQRNRATLYTYQFPATSAAVEVEMGDMFGTSDGGDRNPIWQALTLEKVTVPPTPDDIVLAPANFFPTQKLPIAEVRVVDRRFNASHQLSLVAGEGDTDNARFSFEGAALMPKPFDFSGEAPGKVYSIRVRAVDAGAPARVLEKTFTLTLAAPHGPTAIQLDAESVSSAALPGTLVARLKAVDEDGFDQHVFELVAGAGDSQNAQFTIAGDELHLSRALSPGVTQFPVRLRATDRAGLAVESAIVLPLRDPKIRLNEILASEVSGVVDETRQPQEWIELLNESAQAVDLTGWYLTDDRQDLRKWKIPARTVASGGFLVVLADGTGAVVPGSTNLHANFSLSAAGEWIALVWPDGVKIASELKFPSQYPAVAYGYGPEGTLGYLPKPTPGQTNGAIATAGENAVTFSKSHTFATNAFALELTASVPGSTIRYTLDGSRPTSTTGSVYSGPIQVTPNTTGITRGMRIVRAIAVSPSAAYAPVATQSYLFVNGVAGPGVDGLVSQSRLVTAITRNASYSNLLDDAFLALPALSVVMTGGPTTTETRASIELIDPNGAEPGFQIECGIEATGTTSLGSPKLSMAAKFRPEYGQSRLRYPMFARGSMAPGIAATEFKELRLRSHSHDTFYWLGTSENPPTPYGSPAVTRSGDAQLTRNPWIDEMQILMGQPGKRGRQVHLFLNGSYHGIYHIHEHPDDDFMASYYPGTSDDFHFTGGATTGSEHSSTDTWTKVWSTLKASLSSYAQAKRWVDVTNLCDYMILSFYAGNDWDWSAQHNWGAAGPQYPDRGGWKFFQQDSDITLQDIKADCTDQDVPDGIFTRLMTYPDFRSLFRDRVYKHCYGDGMLTPVRAAALYNARMNELTNAIVVETARWQPGSSVGKLPWDRDEEWTKEWNYLRNTYFPQRTTNLIAQFRKHSGWWPADPPTLSLPAGDVELGARVEFATKTGSVYYTTDGSDPRLDGGGVNPKAQKVVGSAQSLTNTAIASGAVWRFLDTGVQPPAAWANRGFDDSAWRFGATEIGYGEGDESTVAQFVDTDPVSSGVQRNITTYLRRSFELPASSTLNSATLRLRCDDGAVVYLNGRELWRVNMPAGPIDRDTRAVADVDGIAEVTWNERTFAPAELALEPLGNVLAVELHQSGPDSPDLSFNLEFIARVTVVPTGSVVTVDKPVLVRARVYTGTDWSAGVDAYFVPAGTVRASAENMVISEIQYHPLDLPDAEFIEFLNTSPGPVDLSGMVLSNAVSFVVPNATVLPAGGRLVLVKDFASFDSLYRTPGSVYFRNGIRVVGPWDGSLSNGGETIDVLGADGLPILSCAYGTDEQWPGRADGGGSSLELERPEFAPVTFASKSAWLSHPAHWRPSSEFHGSPGAAGLGPDDRIAINEVLAAPMAGDSDGIEFLNISNHTTDLGGWFVTDSSAEYRKYRFAAGTIMEQGGRLTLRSVDFDNAANPACLVPFGLNDTGDDVFLVEATADGSLLRFVDRVEFGPSQLGVSLGRFPEGSGPFVWMRQPTLGSPNSAPLPGYDAWAATTFPPGTTAADMAPDADPDHDGGSNFAEFAFVTSPVQADAAVVEVGSGESGSEFQVTYRTRTAAAGLRYRVELTSDFHGWATPAGGVETVSEQPQPDGATLVTVRVLPGAGDSGTFGKFLRVVVEPQ